jgi:flagellar basal-body rod protein FlgG
MNAQMLAVDTIGNNMANVNTTGFKRETIEFQSLLYETLQGAGHNPAIVGNRPNNLQVGHGVRPVASTRNFSMGQLEPSASPVHFAIHGNGFFQIDRGNGNIAYTRDGAFALSATPGNLRLVTTDGFPVLDVNGNVIDFPDNMDMAALSVGRDGYFSITHQGEFIDLGMQLGIFQFPNRQGLEAIGGNLFVQTVASGEPIQDAPGSVGTPSQIIHRHLERSNVQIAEEMVNLIVSQRAFEINSRIIQTSDDMLQQATNLRR